MVWVNDGRTRTGRQAAWGGSKAGFGRTLSTHGLRECVQVKLVDEDRGWPWPAWWFPYDDRTATALRNGLHVLYGERRVGAAWRYRRRPRASGEARAASVGSPSARRERGGSSHVRSCCDHDGGGIARVTADGSSNVTERSARSPFFEKTKRGSTPAGLDAPTTKRPPHTPPCRLCPSPPTPAAGRRCLRGVCFRGKGDTGATKSGADRPSRRIPRGDTCP